MFDSHCHLTDLSAPDAAISAAHNAGVGTMLTCGYNAESNEQVRLLVERYPHLPFAIGLHPWFADENIHEVLALIHTLQPTAIGEAGLDLWGSEPCQPIDQQTLVLEAQLQLAVQLDLPVTLHCRKAASQLLPILRNHPQVRGALHAYGGSYEQLRPLLDLGLYVGVGGAVTKNRSKRVRRCAAAIPLDRILLETDAPSMGMDIVGPPHVRPAHLPRVRDALAELRHVNPEKIEAVTDTNANQLFGVALPKASL